MAAHPTVEPVGHAEESAHCWGERDRTSSDWARNEKKSRLMAIEVATGKELWRQERRVIPLWLAEDEGGVFFHDGDKVVCLEGRNGEAKWGSEPAPRDARVPTGYSPTLVV